MVTRWVISASVVIDYRIDYRIDFIIDFRIDLSLTETQTSIHNSFTIILNSSLTLVITDLVFLQNLKTFHFWSHFSSETIYRKLMTTNCKDFKC